MTKLSVVISAFNEEKNIKDCIESVEDLADEIVVVDNSSTDNTAKIAAKYTKKIVRQKNDPLKIDLQKNTGFEKASGDWILSLDADERITAELKQEIKAIIILDDEKTGYWIPRKNYIFGKWIQHSLWWPDYQLRLFKNGKGKFLKDSVHKPLELIGEAGYLVQPMIHNNYETISQYISKLDKIYTEVEAQKIVDSGKKVATMDAIWFPVNDFLKTFFLQNGYKDGLHGLVLSLLQAFYAEIVFAKVWEKQGFPEENPPNFLQKLQKEGKKIAVQFQYWFLTTKIEGSSNRVKRLSYRLLRNRVKRKIK